MAIAPVTGGAAPAAAAPAAAAPQAAAANPAGATIDQNTAGEAAGEADAMMQGMISQMGMDGAQQFNSIVEQETSKADKKRQEQIAELKSE